MRFDLVFIAATYYGNENSLQAFFGRNFYGDPERCKCNLMRLLLFVLFCAMAKNKKSKKFDNTMYVTTYLYARDGMSDEQIGKALGASGATFRRWKFIDDALEDAATRGRALTEGQQGSITFPDYVYRHLSPHLRELWDKIHECAELENGVDRIEALLRHGGKHARQHLFIHALASSCFNVSASMRKLNVSRKMFFDWTQNDPAFAELVDEMHWHKENFFEQAFIGRVQAGDTPAILHAVKSQLGARGYNDKLQIEHSGTVEHRHTVDVTDLGLPMDTRKQILKAMRQHAVDAEEVYGDPHTPKLTI